MPIYRHSGRVEWRMGFATHIPPPTASANCTQTAAKTCNSATTEANTGSC